MKEEIKPLNNKQQMFIVETLLPFAKTTHQSKFVTKTLEEVLQLKEYDRIDKFIIEFAINALKEYQIKT